MSHTPLPFAVTFYSYKGGVGRSMLLANVAAALAAKGARVLVIDMDLEAPGIHHIPGFGPTPLPERGLVEWLAEWARDGCPAEIVDDRLRKLDRAVGAANRYGVSVLPAFGFETSQSPGGYAALYASVPWNEMTGAKRTATRAVLERALAHVEAMGYFEFVLIDSRTGITDWGGLLAAAIPNMTICVSNYSRQSTEGICGIWKGLDEAAAGRASYRGNRPPLRRLLVASPVPASDADARELRRDAWKSVFPRETFDGLIEIPFHPRLLLQEDLLAVSGPADGPRARYEQVAQRILDARHDEVRAQELAYAAAVRHSGPDAEEPGTDPRLRTRKGRTFEDRVRTLLELAGWTVEKETRFGGKKVDLIARRELSGEVVERMIECKDHRRPVGVEILESFYGAFADSEIDRNGGKAWCIARDFTADARGLAKAKGRRLIVQRIDEIERELVDFKPHLRWIQDEFERRGLHRVYVEQSSIGRANPEERSPLLPAAMEWAAGKGNGLWLLLGDYGTGKSTFARRLAYELSLAASNPEDHPDAPIPLLIDLKSYPNATNFETLVQEALRPQVVDPRAVRNLLDEGRIVLLLDSFDEMGMAAVGRSVDEQFRELARASVRPDSGERDGEPGADAEPRARGERPPEHSNRVLITCRTSFFRDQQQVKEVAEGRIPGLETTTETQLGASAREFRAAIDEIGLFTAEQIETYLRQRLGDAQAAKAQRFISSMEELGSLAPRPVLLDMIVSSLPELMREGSAVSAGALYDLYTSTWLQDYAGGQLTTKPSQRQYLLRKLAAELWGRADRRIHYREIIGVIEKCESSETAGLDLSRVDIELRTAAFLIRSPDGYYRFSHKSFLEFFFAKALLYAARESAERFRETLTTNAVTREVASFLADLLDALDSERLTAVMHAVLLHGNAPQAAANALRLAAALHRSAWVGSKGARSPLVPRSAKLAGVELTDLQLMGLDLRDASFVGSTLKRVELVGTDVSGADFTDASIEELAAPSIVAANTKWRGASIARAEFGGHGWPGADFRGADFSESTVRAADFAGADLRRARFLRASLRSLTFARANLVAVEWGGARIVASVAPGAATDESAIRGLADRPQRLRRLICAGAWHDVASVAFAPDGATALFGCHDGTARWIDLHTRKEQASFRGGGQVVSVAVAPDGGAALLGCKDGTARWIDLATRRERASFLGGGQVMSVAIAPDGGTALLGCQDGTARWIDLATRKERASFPGGGQVLSVAFAPDGTTALLGCDDAIARWIDLGTREERALFPGGGRVTSVAFAPDGATALLGCAEGPTRWVDLVTRDERASFRPSGEVLSVAFAPDGGTALLGCGDGTVRWIELGTREERASFRASGQVLAVSFAPDGETALVGCQGGTAHWIDVATSEERASFRGGGIVWSVALAPDGRTALLGCSDGTTRWIELTSLEERASFRGGGTALSVAFAPDGGTALLGCGDGTARWIDLGTRRERASFRGGGIVWSVAFAPDGGTALLGCQDGTARWIDLATREERASFQGGGIVWSVAFAPDGGTALLGCSDGTARWIDLATQEERASFRGSGVVWRAVFAPDGGTALLGCGDGTTRWIDLGSRAERTSIRGGGRWTSAIAFAPDGGTALLEGPDKSVRWIDLATQELRASFQVGGDVWSGAFSPDGMTALIGCGDGTARWIELETGSERATFVAAGGFALVLPDGRCRGDAAFLDRVIRYTDDEDHQIPPALWTVRDLPEMVLPNDWKPDNHG